MTYMLLRSYTVGDNAPYGQIIADPDVDPPYGYRWEHDSRWHSGHPELVNSYTVRMLWFRAIEKET